MKITENLSYNWIIALEAITQNKIRSILTSLGIICGTASVIGMLAIGSGAKEEIIEKMKVLGTNNIIINSTFDEELSAQDAAEGSSSGTGSDTGEENSEGESKNKYSPGLSLEDVESIKKIIPSVSVVSPTITEKYMAYNSPFKIESNLVGITETYKSVNNFSITKGRDFSNFDLDNGKQVCILGTRVAKKLFPAEEPIGKKIKVAGLWFDIIGTSGKLNISVESLEGLGERNFNNDIYIPISTVLLRIKNAKMISKGDLMRGRGDDSEKNDYNQINKIVVQADDTKMMMKYAELIDRVLLRRHNGVADYEIIVPEELLKQEQETTRIFNMVLGIIASISLLVGGIGIMNIMLASVLERTREIGIRMAVGAKRKDIAEQFLFEAIAISLSGGFLGVVTGVAASFVIEALSGITTIISLWSVLLAFVVSMTVGLAFGIIPAKKASQQNTIDLLRYE